MRYFYVDQVTQDRYTILIDYRNVPITRMERGTAFKIASLLYDISYPNFLRMARDKFNGVITGKNCMYPSLNFSNKEDPELLVKELNTRMAIVMKDWKEKFNNGKEYSRSC